MKKKNLVVKILVLLTISISAYGQQTGRIVYKSLLSLNDMRPAYEELIFENNKASYTLLSMEFPERYESDGTGIRIIFNTPKDRHPVILIDNAANSILSRVYLTDDLRTHTAYLVTEGFEIDWKITNQTKQIAGHNARAAKADFRGRSYSAWFTTDLPVAFGPWKFQGLPGLVLLVTDTTGEVKFKVEEIEIPTERTVKRLDDSDIQSAISFQEFCSIRKRKTEQAISGIKKFIREITPRGATVTVGEPVNNLIEREC